MKRCPACGALQTSDHYLGNMIEPDKKEPTRMALPDGHMILLDSISTKGRHQDRAGAYDVMRATEPGGELTPEGLQWLRDMLRSEWSLEREMAESTWTELRAQGKITEDD